MDLLPLPPPRRHVPLLARLLVQCAVLFALLCLFAEAIAYAQGGGGNAPLTAFSAATLFVSLGGMLVAALAQGYNTGTIFGKQVPKPWLPYLGFAGTFLVAAVASIKGATGPVDGLAWYNALQAGFYALVGPTVGVTFVQHAFAHKGGGGTAGAPPAGGGTVSPLVAGAAKAAAMLALCTMAFVAWAAYIGSGCTAQQGTKVVSGLPTDATFMACVWATYQGEPAGTPILQVLDDEVKACGGDGAAVVSTLDQKEPRALHAAVAHAAAK